MWKHRIDCVATIPMEQPPMDPGLRDQALPVERVLGLALLGLLAIGTFIILRPFISALLWAVIITYSTSSLNRKLQTWLRGRRSLAAMLATLLVGAVIVLPLALVSITLTERVPGRASTSLLLGQARPSGGFPRERSNEPCFV